MNMDTLFFEAIQIEKENFEKKSRNKLVLIQGWLYISIKRNWEKKKITPLYENDFQSDFLWNFWLSVRLIAIIIKTDACCRQMKIQTIPMSIAVFWCQKLFSL